MSLLDGALAVALGLGVWRGLHTGATVQIAGAVGGLAAFVAAVAWGPVVGATAVSSLDLSPRTAPLVGAVVVFAAVAGAVWAGAHALRKTLRALSLGALDRVAGGGVGGLRTAFGLSLALGLLSFAPLGRPLLLADETCEASVLCRPVQAVAPALWTVANAVAPALLAPTGGSLPVPAP